MLGLMLAGAALNGIGNAAMSYNENKWRERDLREQQLNREESARQHNENLAEKKRQWDGEYKLSYDRFFEEKRQYNQADQLNREKLSLEKNMFAASESQRRIENAGFFNQIGLQR